MIKEKSISVVIPCYNEETQIESVVNGIPDYIDKIILIDDKSSDNTYKIIKQFENNNSRIFTIFHNENKGVGAAIASGYKWARDNNIDVAVNDGDAIVHLIEYADRILQFKKNTCYVINISGATEYLEAEHKFKGISNPGAANSALITREKKPPIKPATNAKIIYSVPISLWFVEKNQRLIKPGL